MLILGIETSGPRGSIAICRDGECLAEVELENAPRRHAQTLVSQIGETFRRLGLKVAELDAVAVSIGPGSFTGLRVGVVCAKTLAYAVGCRLTAVDTLEAIAANSPLDVDWVHVIADAQRGDLFVADYRRKSHTESKTDWLRDLPPRIVRAEDWFASLAPGDVVSGPGLSIAPQKGSDSWRKLPEAAWHPTARQVAAIGTSQIGQGVVADVATLEPLYIRRSAAEEKADRPQSTSSH
jgi:tRNA threonylcarbamoyladenosine biosynthesis protein TsaB